MQTGVATGAIPLTLKQAQERISEVEQVTGAWAHVDEHPAVAAVGPLAGWTIGVKDLIDVAGMPTGAGAIGRQESSEAKDDAAIVTTLRRAGATILGKTVAVEYGWFGTVTTRNPHDLARSPGGSSSGSAAAVAAGMCRAAIGTQTAGSVIRPAAYTGVPALKLSHGAVDLAGVVKVSGSLDSLGIFAGSLDDLQAVADVLLGPTAEESSDSTIRIGLILDEFRDVCDDSVLDAVDRSVRALASSSQVELVNTASALDWSQLRTAHRALMVRECALARADAFRADPTQFSAVLRSAIEDGLALNDAVRTEALEAASQARAVLESAEVDMWLTPAATQEAPPAGEPGDPACQSPFTLLGLPAIHLPVGRGASNLPVGLQLVGRLNTDRRLLRQARSLAAAMADGGLQ